MESRTIFRADAATAAQGEGADHSLPIFTFAAIVTILRQTQAEDLLPEPITIGALALAGVGTIAGTIAGGIAGNVSDRVFCGHLRNLKARFAGMLGKPENEHVARSIRVVQMQALERVVKDYRALDRPEWATQPHLRPDMFFQRAIAFCAANVGRCRQLSVQINFDITPVLTAAFDGLLASAEHDGPSVQRAAAIAVFAEDHVLDELREALDGVVLPEGFEQHFRKGQNDRLGFLDLFGHFASDELKHQDEFRRIWMAEKLAIIEGLSFDTTEMLAVMDRRFGAALARIEAKAEESLQLQKSHLEETRAIRYEIAREKGIEPEKLVPIFEALGHEKLTPDEMRERAEEAIAGIVAKANEIIKPSNDGADIDAAIGAARVKLKEIDTAGARGILAAKIAEEEDNRKQRLLPLLREQADIEMLALDRTAAKTTLHHIVALDPANGWAWVEIGDLQRIAGTTSAALEAFSKALAADREAGDEVRTSVALDRIGDVLRAQGDLSGALENYREGLEIRRRLLSQDPSHSERARDVSVSVNKIGDVLVAQGALEGALENYSEALEISRRLLSQDPSHSERARDVSVSLAKMAVLEVQRGDAKAACALLNKASRSSTG